MAINDPQPDPKENDLPAVWDLVIKDMHDRDNSGFKKYGTRLQPNNGRNSLIDAYQEVLDLAVYLRQTIYERDNPENTQNDDEPIHNWFGLSYSQYLTIPRSVLQSMPVEWQRTFVKCLEELDDTIFWRPINDKQYRCMLYKVNYDADENEEYWKCELDDPLMDYERGRRKLPYRTVLHGGKI